jgi:ribose 1,5-bisphosphokinase
MSAGGLIAVVGPSGAGKDTLLDLARAALAKDDRIVFVRRVITRPCDGGTEDHDTLDVADFDKAEIAGAFAISWRAHGLRYGLPKAIDAQIAAGKVLVANVSRGIIPAMRATYPSVEVVEITARPEILAARLGARGRETQAEVEARLARTVAAEHTDGAIVLDNSGARDIAGNRLVTIIRSIAERTEMARV